MLLNKKKMADEDREKWACIWKKLATEEINYNQTYKRFWFGTWGENNIYF